MANVYEKLFASSNYTINDLATKSSAWFRQEAARLRKTPINTKSFIVADGGDIVKRIEIGRMYIFRYAPKYMDSLSVWDEYPLVLPFSGTPDGFIGINFHYLPYRHRAWVLDRPTRNVGSETKRLRVSWQILNSLSRADVGSWATHRYIMSNITTPLRLVNIDDYPKAILLPIAKFHGPDTKTVNRLIGWF